MGKLSALWVLGGDDVGQTFFRTVVPVLLCHGLGIAVDRYLNHLLHIRGGMFDSEGRRCIDHDPCQACRLA